MKSVIGLKDFTEVLDQLRSSKRRGAAKYTYNQLTQILGYKSPRTLAMVHKGQRAPSANLVKKICDYLVLTSKERDYIYTLAEKSIASKKNLSLANPEEKLKKLSYKSSYIQLTEDDLRAFSHCFFSVVKQIIQSSKSGVTLLEIQKKLNEPLTLNQIKVLTDHLEKLNFCKKNSNGKFLKTTDHFIITTSEIPSPTIRQLHRLNLERTLRTLDQPLEKRELMTSSLSVKKSDLKQIKKRMKEFLFEVLDEYGHPETGEVIVQLNLQLFEQALLK